MNKEDYTFRACEHGRKTVMRKLMMLVSGVLLAIAACAVQIPENTPAPPLKVTQWIKGAPVDLAAIAGKKVAVIEFWATWCPPCRESIPHLTKLQKQYKDQVVFAGISNETANDVKPFVEKMGDKMEYAVAVDDQDQTVKAYMDAWGLNNIPYAFIVGKNGKILWNGSPLDSDFEDALKKAVSQ
jgi:thiol-disulfide isomerase/thioredoxin